MEHLQLKKFFSIVFFCFIKTSGFPQEIFKQPIIPIKGEIHVEIIGLKKIECDSSIGKFEIGSGSFDVNASGLIDRSANRKTHISLFADVTLKSEFMIFLIREDKRIQYFVEGIPAGSYSGLYSDNGFFTVDIKFKIVAPERLPCLLVLPIIIYVSPEGKVSSDRSFIGAEGRITEFKKASKKKLKRQKTQFAFD